VSQHSPAGNANPSSREVPVVLVHLGPSRPRWLVPTLRSLEASGYNSVLVVDRSYWGSLVPPSVQLLQVEQRPVSKSEFREGFWSLTTERFKALAEAHAQLGTQILHLESDVRLAPGLNLELLASLVRPVAFPLLAAGRGSGASVLLRDPPVSELLASCLQTYRQKSGCNDMEGLWRFWVENPALVSLLPSTEPPDDARLRESIGSVWVSESDHLRTALGGIFDSASYGQFLFGSDGRNNRWGIRFSGCVNPEHFAQPTIDRMSKPAIWPLEFSSGFHLLSAHVHSKDPRVLERENPLAYISGGRGRQHRQLDPWALRINIMSAIARRFCSNSA
jgi:hypothetical protein